MDSPAERAQAQVYWRRQLQLTALAGAAFVVTLAATKLVLADWGRDPDHRFLVITALAISVVWCGTVLVALLVHAWRVAAFTFRRGDS
jgi:hypothetical protein